MKNLIGIKFSSSDINPSVRLGVARQGRIWESIIYVDFSQEGVLGGGGRALKTDHKDQRQSGPVPTVPLKLTTPRR